MFVEEYLADLRHARYRPRAWFTYVRRCVALAREHAFLNPHAMRSLGVTGVIGFVCLLAVAVVVALSFDARLGLEFFIKTGVLLLVGLVWIGSHIRLLVRSSGEPLTRINPANLLTLSRLVSIAALLVFVEHDHLKLGLATFLIGASTDVVDGWLARARHDATPLGRVFDPLVDVFFASAVMLSLNHEGYLPDWVLALVLLRYSLLLVGAAAIYIFRGPVEIKPTVLGKATGVVTTVLVFALVGGAFLLQSEVYHRIAMLLATAVGFVEAITIPQVVLIGLYNMKRAGGRAQAALKLVEVERHGTHD